ncbi:MAG: DUF1249 domain-containing protein [Gammaproteobacteria bacterium]|jgi:uncharacterized protein YqiB (DUF1249 family)
MLIDSYILPECIVRPGSFGGLMVLYEANFIKLKQLAPDLQSGSEQRISKVHNDCDLHLSLADKTKYTCSLRLTYYFDDEIKGRVAEPDLLAKIYFDARMVEVKGWTNVRRHRALRVLDAGRGRPLDVCWSRNIMLGKWLDFLLDQGHLLASC